MLSCSVTPRVFKLLLLHLVHAELEASWGQVHPRHHRAHIQRVHGIVFVLGLEQRLLCVLVRHVLPAIVDVTVEHGIATITPVPGVEWIVRENQSDPIAYVLLLVVLDLHELVPEVVVVKELVVVVAKNEVLLSLQLLQQSNGCPYIMHRHITQYEDMIIVLHYAIPILDYAVVKFLRSIQLVTGESYLVLCPSDWTRIRLVAKVNVRYVEAIG